MSKNILINVVRLLAGTIVGYLSLYAFLIVTLEIMLGGNVDYSATLPKLLAGGICAFGSSLIAAIIGCLISGKWWKITPILMSILSYTETTYLIQTEILTGPLWFDILGATNLAFGFFAGMLTLGFLKKIRHSSSAIEIKSASS